jgi:hypothetical protein
MGPRIGRVTVIDQPQKVRLDQFARTRYSRRYDGKRLLLGFCFRRFTRPPRPSSPRFHAYGSPRPSQGVMRAQRSKTPVCRIPIDHGASGETALQVRTDEEARRVTQTSSTDQGDPLRWIV